MSFRDRVDAGRRLADRLGHLADSDVVVVALPRGGIPVAAEIARVLHAPMDVVVVRKLGVPYQPELAMGALGEDGVVVWNDDVRSRARVTDAEAATVVQRETAELYRRAAMLRGEHRPPADVAGRTVVVVDDGIATGSTAVAACRVLRARGARRVIVAVPVAPPSAVARLADEADDVVTVSTPSSFSSVGEWYDDFTQVTDDQAVRFVRPAAPATRSDASVTVDVTVAGPGVALAGELSMLPNPRAVVVFAHGSNSDRTSPRNRAVAAALNERGFATLLFDLLTEAERATADPQTSDIEVLGRRVCAAVAWAQQQEALKGLPVGLFGASTGGAVALWAAAEPRSPVAAVVCRGGRPDLVPSRIPEVSAPTLLIVGGRDGWVEDLNRRALPLFQCTAELSVVTGAGHLFDQPGALASVADLASEWFRDHLIPQTVPVGAGSA